VNWPRLTSPPVEERQPTETLSPAEIRRRRALRLVTDAEPARSPERRKGMLLGDNRAYILRRLLAISDLWALLLSGVAAAGIQFLVRQELPNTADALVFAAFVPIWLVVANLVGLYHLSDRRLDHSAADEFGPVAVALTAWSWCFLVARTFAESGPIQELPSLTLWVTAIAALLACRALTRGLARRQPWYRQRVAVAGSPRDISQVVRRISRHPEFGLDIVHTLELNGNGNGHTNGGDLELGPIWTSQGVEHNAKFEDHTSPVDTGDVADLARAYGINRVIIATHSGDIEERSELVRALSQDGIHVDMITGEPEAFSGNTALHYVEGMPVLTIPAAGRPRAWKAVKRGFDVVTTAAGLFFLSPLFAYCAIRIKLGSGGPVFFRQERVGRDGRTFQVLKFRTMVADADAQKHTLAGLNIHDGTDTPGMFKIPEDPRVTPFGAKLRRWSIDELPQLWNVLKGEMSLVGPRPLIPEEAIVVEDHYKERMNMRPGITGTWQTLGRSDIGFGDMVKLDYSYVVNWSFSEDMRLLIRTLGAVTQGRGAY
jgi:exopolysaccharide biosynthesis polyprenyl glycosylphosphotransferase